VKERRHLWEVRRTPVVHHVNTSEISAFTLRRFANRGFVSQQCDPRQAISRADGRRNHRARIVPLGQDNMLWFGGRTLANSFQDFHRKRDLLAGCASR
jgi:hypothetical protein